MPQANLPLELELDPHRAAWLAAKKLLKTNPMQAVVDFRALAEAGSTMSMLELGWCYATGTGVVEDADEAESWYSRVAQTGSRRAHYYLGRCRCRFKKYDKAREAFEFSAARGFAPALLDLGKIYYLGLGVPKDADRARTFLVRAADAGNLRAKGLLARMAFDNAAGWFDQVRSLRKMLAVVYEVAIVIAKEGLDSTRLMK